MSCHFSVYFAGLGNKPIRFKMRRFNRNRKWASFRKKFLEKKRQFFPECWIKNEYNFTSKA